MELHFEEFLGKITDFIKTEAKTETVVGEQFQLGEFKCVPVIKVGMGFGSGGGEGTEAKAKKRSGNGCRSRGRNRTNRFFGNQRR